MGIKCRIAARIGRAATNSTPSLTADTNRIRISMKILNYSELFITSTVYLAINP